MRVYEQLYELYFLHFSVCLWLLDTQSFHQPAVLLSSNAERLIFTPRPLELALFKPFVEQEKAVAFPVERLNSVSSSAAKQEQRVGTRVKPELLFNDSSNRASLLIAIESSNSLLNDIFTSKYHYVNS